MAAVSLSWALFAGVVAAQSSGPFANGTTPNASTVNGTPTTNASLFATTINISVEDLWDTYIGPVEMAAINTTVSATPVPTNELVPPPPIYYSSSPSGAQNPLYAKNSSWSFPKNFWWGVASAAYQVEGAAKAEGRGPSVWDKLTRITGYTVANQTGDVADNQYYLYKQDIARIAALGVPYYSFSISWSRVLPFGKGPVNEQALAHYDDLIETCLQYNVQPVVTLFHWDTPLYLQNLYGGWLSEEIVGDFVEYARIVFGRYGNRVQHWFTLNEPIVFCDEYPFPSNYFTSSPIPPKQQPFHCGQSALLAHSQAYHLGKSMGLNGSISFKNNGGYKVPLTNSSADAIAVQRAWDFNEGWFATPTFLTGDYAPYLKEYVSTFLRPFTDAEKSAINGSSDVFAHDAYTSQFYMAPDSGIDACTSNASHPLYPSCVNSTYQYSAQDGGWNIGYAADPASPWLHKASDWVPIFLHYIQETWKPSGGIAVSEFGFAEPFEQLKQLRTDIQFDYARSGYYHDYMQAILLAMSEGVNVVGCLAWSILDNLEWSDGYTVKFGMQYVNYTTQERFYKASFFEYINAFNEYQEDYDQRIYETVKRLTITPNSDPFNSIPRPELLEENSAPGKQIGPYSKAIYHQSGLFSTIYRAPSRTESTRLIALKLTTPSRTEPPHDPEREARILAFVKNPHIISLLSTFPLAGGHFILVFPFLPLDLESLLHSPPNHQRITSQQARSHLRSLFSALAHLHSLNIIHRDLKPSNILLASPSGPAYLADFGIAWMPGDAASEPAERKITDVGTTCYRPPELLFGYTAYGCALDLWAAGCVVAEVVMACTSTTPSISQDRNKPLFDSGPLGSELALILSIFKTLGTPNSDTWPEARKFPDWGKMDFVEFRAKLWEDILPGTTEEARTLVSGLLRYESSERSGAEDALHHPFFSDV